MVDNALFLVYDMDYETDAFQCDPPSPLSLLPVVLLDSWGQEDQHR
jgi:hypothetical protein